MDFAITPLGRVSGSQEMMILREVLRFGVDFNRPLNHFVRQIIKDDELLVGPILPAELILVGKEAYEGHVRAQDLCSFLLRQVGASHTAFFRSQGTHFRKNIRHLDAFWQCLKMARFLN